MAEQYKKIICKTAVILNLPTLRERYGKDDKKENQCLIGAKSLKKIFFPDSPGIPASATAHELFRGFSFVAPALLGETKPPDDPLDNHISLAKVRTCFTCYACVHLVSLANHLICFFPIRNSIAKVWD